jgi:hypothetical protein
MAYGLRFNLIHFCGITPSMVLPCHKAYDIEVFFKVFPNPLWYYLSDLVVKHCGPLMNKSFSSFDLTKKIHKVYRFLTPFISHINPRKHKMKASTGKNYSTSTQGPSSLNQWILIIEF